MYPKNSTPIGLPAAVILAILCGFIGLVVLFIAGSRSGSSTYAIFVACLWFLFGAVWIAKRFPSGTSFSGALINLPLWLFLLVLADPGQFKAFKGGLAACLASAYLGTFLGRWRPAMKLQANRQVLAMIIPATIVAVVVLFFAAQSPTPIPGDKQLFVGLWKSASGFELQINPDGRALIVHNSRGAPNLDFPRAESDTIDGVNVHFIGDTILEVVKPAYYGRTYKIDRNPYRDSAADTMILNGTILLRQ